MITKCSIISRCRHSALPRVPETSHIAAADSVQALPPRTKLGWRLRGCGRNIAYLPARPGAWLSILFCLCVPVAVAPSTSAAEEAGLDAAIEEYSAAMEAQGRDERLRRFSRAEQLFRQAIEDPSTQAGADLFVNLGNAALQAEHVGSAIVAYRRALLLEPGHRQAKQNLRYARSMVPNGTGAEETSDLIDTLFFWQTLASREQIQLVAACFFLLAATLFSIGFAGKRSWLCSLALVPLSIWLLLLLSTAPMGQTSDEAVVVSGDTILHAADSENSASRLSQPIPDGTEVKILQTRDRWTEIQIAGRSGWVLASSLQRVSQ